MFLKFRDGSRAAAFGGVAHVSARPVHRRVPGAAYKRAARASTLNQALCSHFSKMASHCCVAHLTDSSAVIAPVAAFAIMSQMMKLL